MRIARVAKPSPAWDAGLRAGDEILSIDGMPVRDALEFTYLSADDAIVVELRRDEEVFDCELEREPDEQWGLELPEDSVRCCGNQCVFCFIDQNPRDLRPTLYVKDEDYRLSVIYGNYVTLTNLKDWEIERILLQHLSPLYVSVHATDPVVRRRLLRSRARHDIMALMRRLGEGGITLHTQIVLVPGYNDGAVLEDTLNDLEALHPAVATVAIVPVGLTKHRANLPPLREVTSEEAAQLVEQIGGRQRRCLRSTGSRIHFLADEIYLLAGAPLPEADAYEGFPQVENGVGLVRAFDLDLDERDRLFSVSGKRDQDDLPAGEHDHRPQAGKDQQTAHGPDTGAHLRAAVVTGQLFAPLLRQRLPRALARTGEAPVWVPEVVAVDNALFGRSVTVAGLLGGADVVAELAARRRYDRVVLPLEMFNTDGFTLDHRRPQDLAEELGAELQLGWNGEVVRPRAA